VVRREFPNKLRVTLTEQVPVANWGDEAGSKLINGFGDVFEANVAEVDDNLPRLDGPVEQAGQVLGMYRCCSRSSSPTTSASTSSPCRAGAAGRWCWTAARRSSSGAARARK
jgi:cell division septal protein FtsQ